MGVPFSFYNFTGLVDLQRGIVERLDVEHVEAFSILYCNFSSFDKAQIDESLKQVVRLSDAYVHNDNSYFFILYQTDRYGATIVAKMFEDFFAQYIHHDIVCYPKDGESAQDLFDCLQTQVKKKLNIYLDCLDKNSREKPV